MKNILCVYVTFPDRKTAGKISTTLVKEKLAACANIIPKIESVYSWKGRIHRDPECLTFFKTRPTLLTKLSRRLRELHPYECPCIVVYKSAGGFPPYLNWVIQETK